MSGLRESGNEQVLRYARLAGLPQARSATHGGPTPVTHASTPVTRGPALATRGLAVGSRPVDSVDGVPRRSTSPSPRLNAVSSRGNMVTARTRFFEEKSRSASPVTPPLAAQRRSRSATRFDDRRTPAHCLGHNLTLGSPSTPPAVRRLPAPAPPVTATTVNGQRQTTSTSAESTPSSVDSISVSDETDTLKV